MKIPALTKTQLKIMQVLWESSEPLTVSDISSELNISVTSMNNMVNQLIKNGFIEISGMKRTANHYSRTLSPVYTKEQYAAKLVSSLNVKTKSFFGVITAFMKESAYEDGNEKFISDLEEVLKKYENKEEGCDDK